MIKAEVTVVGTVMQPTQTKKYSQGGYFFSSTLKTSVPQAGGGFKEVNVSISAPQKILYISTCWSRSLGRRTPVLLTAYPETYP